MSSSCLEWSSLDPLDATFLRTLQSVQSLYTTLPRSSQIRVEQWCTQLSQACVHKTWRRSRNLYSELLLQSIQKGALCPPFHKLPKIGPLPQLPPEITLSLLGSRNKSSGFKKSVPLSHIIPQSIAIWNTIFSSVGMRKESKKERGCELSHPQLEKVVHPPSFCSAPLSEPTSKLGKGRVDTGLMDCYGEDKWSGPFNTPQWESDGVFKCSSSRNDVNCSGSVLQSSLDTKLALAIETLAKAHAACATAEANVKVLQAREKSEGSPQAILLSSEKVSTEVFRHENKFMAEETLLQHVGELRALRALIARFLAEKMLGQSCDLLRPGA
jgi:hypothetical protein